MDWNKKTASLQLAAIAAAVFLFAPVAMAEKPGAAVSEESFKAQFSFNPTDPPERIYSHLRSVAIDACSVRGERSLRLEREARLCAYRLIDQAVSMMGRSDVAAIHQGKLQHEAANGHVFASSYAIAGG